MLEPLAKILRHPLFLCLVSFCFCFCVALLLFLPLQPFTQQVEQLAEQQGLDLQIEAPRRLFPPGLKAEKVQLSTPQINHAPFIFQNLAAHPLWSSLTGDNPGLRFEFETFQGRVRGTAFRNGKLTANFIDLKIDEPLGAKLPLSLTGNLDSGVFDGNLPLQGKNRSKLQLEMSGLLLSGMQKFGSNHDDLPIGQLRCEIQSAGPILKINTLETTGTAFELKGNGTLRLGQTPASSSLNLDLTLTLKDSLDPLLKDMLSLLKKPRRDGTYLLRVNGSLANLRLN